MRSSNSRFLLAILAAAFAVSFALMAVAQPSEPGGDTPSVTEPAQGAASEEPPGEEPAVAQEATEEPAAVEAPVEGSGEATPIEEPATEEIPAEGTGEAAPVEEPAAEEIPAEEPAAAQAPPGGTGEAAPLEEPAAEEVPAEAPAAAEAPAEGTGEAAPLEEPAAQEIPAEGTGEAALIGEPDLEVAPSEGTGEEVVEPAVEVLTEVEPEALVEAVEEVAPVVEEVFAAEVPGATSIEIGALRGPIDVAAVDTPGDYGGSITITWQRSPDDLRVGGRVLKYMVLYRVEPGEQTAPEATEEDIAAEAEPPAEDVEGEQPEEEPVEPQWVFYHQTRAGVTRAVFDEAERGQEYRFMVAAVGVEADEDVELLGSGTALRVLASVPVITEPVEALDDLLLGDDGLDPRPPADVVLRDVPWDKGEALRVTWTASPDDHVVHASTLFERFVTYLYEGLAGAERGYPFSYDVLLRPLPDGFWQKVGEVQAGFSQYVITGLSEENEYEALVVAISPGGYSAAPEPAAALSPRANWYYGDKLYIGILGLIISIFIIAFIESARRGKKPFIRKIAGLEAIDEAIGRATEMGRPILYVPGIGDMDNVQTLAGLNILGHVSKTIAEYDTRIDVPVCRSLVMTAGREVVKQAYLEAGRPDAFDEGCCHYITDAQFGYVAGVNGIIVRDKPATCFYQGAFYAESLILAETGNLIGAIQIAGTAMPAQLPFFIAACDYTLIGEELFAASAYLSGDPKQLGSLKGQDVGKLIVMFALIIGSLAATVAHLTALEFHSASNVFNWVVEFLQDVFM